MIGFSSSENEFPLHTRGETSRGGGERLLKKTPRLQKATELSEYGAGNVVSTGKTDLQRIMGPCLHRAINISALSSLLPLLSSSPSLLLPHSSPSLRRYRPLHFSLLFSTSCHFGSSRFGASHVVSRGPDTMGSERGVGAGGALCLAKRSPG